jgi:hypothetical protein
VVKKEVVVASMSSMEAFPTTGIALQLEVSMTAASISGPKVGEECWNSGLDARLEAVAANIHLEAVVTNILVVVVVVTTSNSSRLWEILPMASWVLDPYENPIT